jgi:hypothetical protein
VRITLDQPVNDVASSVRVSASDGLYNSGVVTVVDGNTLVLVFSVEARRNLP